MKPMIKIQITDDKQICQENKSAAVINKPVFSKSSPAVIFSTVVPRSIVAAFVVWSLLAAFLWLPNVPSPLLVTTQAAGSITSRVFDDVDRDGINDGVEPGVGGVVITAYNSSGTVAASAVSGSDGVYLLDLTAVPNGTPLRLEATGIPSGYAPGFVGFSNSSTVRFVTAGASTPGFEVGLNNLAAPPAQDYLMAVTGQVNGGLNTAGVTRSIYRWRYNQTGTEDVDTATVALGQKIQTGSLWGLAYQPVSDTLFSAAVLRRHSAMYENPVGTPHPGQIFIATNVSTATPGAPTPFFDVAAVPSVNLGTVASNALRNLDPSVTPLDDSIDNPSSAPTYGLAGKVGLGDLDITPDQQFLWTVSLNDKKLIRFPAGSPTAANSSAFVIPAPSGAFACTNGTHRPFALEFSGSQLYVGMVCDASGAGATAANLKAVVMTTPWASPTGVFTPVFQTPLNYTKGYTVRDCPTSFNQFSPWSDAEVLRNCGAVFSLNPQPLLTDLEIDDDGSLIMAFKDRAGLQQGALNTPPISTEINEENNVNGGDLLRACAVGGNFVLQGGAGCANRTPNNQGPGGGEWYFQDNSSLFSGEVAHQENQLGGTAHIPGRGEIITTCFSCLGAGFENAGVQRHSNSTGASVSTFLITSNGQGFQKSGGLGDMEVLRAIADSIEIGNRVWNDNTNKNGVQDANEPGIGGVILNLFVDTDDNPGTPLVQVATTTTDAAGNYLFSSALSGTGTAGGRVYGIASLIPNRAFEVRIPTAAYPSGLSPTVATADPSANGTLRDSNGVASGAGSIAAGVTGAAGTSNTTIDFGFASVSTSAELDLSGRVTLSSGKGLPKVTVQLLDTATGTVRTALTNGQGYYRFEGIDLNSFVIVTVDRPGFTFTPRQRSLSLVETLETVDFLAVSIYDGRKSSR